MKLPLIKRLVHRPREIVLLESKAAAPLPGPRLKAGRSFGKWNISRSDFLTLHAFLRSAWVHVCVQADDNDFLHTPTLRKKGKIDGGIARARVQGWKKIITFPRRPSQRFRFSFEISEATDGLAGTKRRRKRHYTNRITFPTYCLISKSLVYPSPSRRSTKILYPKEAKRRPIGIPWSESFSRHILKGMFDSHFATHRVVDLQGRWSQQRWRYVAGLKCTQRGGRDGWEN